MANCLSRLTVDESKLDRRKRERKEEEEEIEDMRRLEEFKKKKPPSSRKETGNHEANQTVSVIDLLNKKRRNKEKVESKSKRRRLDDSVMVMDLQLYLSKAEERCMRVGMLKLQLERDKARMLRRMECLEWDRIASELPAWWNRMKEENLSLASPGEEDDHQSLLSSHDDDVTRTILVGVGARHPINKPPDGLSSCFAKSKQKHPAYNLVGLTG